MRHAPSPPINGNRNRTGLEVALTTLRLFEFDFEFGSANISSDWQRNGAEKKHTEKKKKQENKNCDKYRRKKERARTSSVPHLEQSRAELAATAANQTNLWQDHARDIAIVSASVSPPILQRYRLRLRLYLPHSQVHFTSVEREKIWDAMSPRAEAAAMKTRRLSVVSWSVCQSGRCTGRKWVGNRGELVLYF